MYVMIYHHHHISVDPKYKIVHPRVYTSIRVNYCDFVSGSVVIVVVVMSCRDQYGYKMYS